MAVHLQPSSTFTDAKTLGGNKSDIELESKKPLLNGGADIDELLEQQLPEKLKQFLQKPMNSHKDIPGLIQPKNNKCFIGCLSCLFPCAYCCCLTDQVIQEGQIGFSWRQEEPHVLDAGWHW